MNFNVYRSLSGIQKMQINRLKRVMQDGSPKYHFDVSALAATATEGFDIATQFPRARKYEPLDTILIINNDVVDISVLVNGAGGDLLIVPAGTIRRSTRDEVPAISRISVTNLDAGVAVTVNLIDIEIWRSPEDADSLARRDV